MNDRPRSFKYLGMLTGHYGLLTVGYAVGGSRPELDPDTEQALGKEACYTVANIIHDNGVPELPYVASLGTLYGGRFPVLLLDRWEPFPAGTVPN